MCLQLHMIWFYDLQYLFSRPGVVKRPRRCASAAIFPEYRQGQKKAVHFRNLRADQCPADDIIQPSALFSLCMLYIDASDACSQFQRLMTSSWAVTNMTFDIAKCIFIARRARVEDTLSPPSRVR